METTKQNTVLSINLKAVMAEKGMKSMQLSMKSGVPLSRIGDILRSKTLNPQINTVAKLAEALEVPIDDLMSEPCQEKAAV